MIPRRAPAAFLRLLYSTRAVGGATVERQPGSRTRIPHLNFNLSLDGQDLHLLKLIEYLKINIVWCEQPVKHQLIAFITITRKYFILNQPRWVNIYSLCNAMMKNDERCKNARQLFRGWCTFHPSWTANRLKSCPTHARRMPRALRRLKLKFLPPGQPCSV